MQISKFNKNELKFQNSIEIPVKFPVNFTISAGTGIRKNRPILAGTGILPGSRSIPACVCLSFYLSNSYLIYLECHRDAQSKSFSISVFPLYFISISSSWSLLTFHQSVKIIRLIALLLNLWHHTSHFQSPHSPTSTPVIIWSILIDQGKGGDGSKFRE